MELSEEQQQRIKDYYLQDAVVGQMTETAKHREFAPTYPRGYGSRPDAVNFPEDFKNFVRKGAIAFHGSVELWKNPLLIGRTDQDTLRQGWDLVIDIDADDGIRYAKQAVRELLNEFKRHGIDPDLVSAKFSGNRGFHLGIKRECFPDSIGGEDIASLYPKLPQAIVGYLRDRIEDRLAERLTGMNPDLRPTIEEEGPFAVADVENDWGQRHLFRMPYSINEKTIGGDHGMLVSKPLKIKDIDDFRKVDAHIDRIDADKGFLDDYEENVATDLAVEALDWLSRQRVREREREDREKKRKSEDYDIPDEALAKEHFPAPIKRIMQGLEDGRKRALFILVTFLRHVGYDWDAIEKEIWEWNDRTKVPLQENYVKTQLQWHRNQDEPLMPPNFDAKGWYEDIGVIDDGKDQQMLDNFDNPVPYASVLEEKASNQQDDGGEEHTDDD
ncbi:MAG: hypothetical protein SVU32_03640 [Candidatus Nanohaloarchaea archaeon]|nr:hypothetical protein [Candidatus Nanohaloarchaea archaeon]